MIRYDRLLTIGLIIIETFYFVLIKALPEKAAKYPYFVLGLLFMLTIVLAVRSFVLKGEEEQKPFAGFQIRQFLFIVLISAVYLFLIEQIGFFMMTFIYLLIVMFGLKSNFKWAVVSSITFCVVIYFVFLIFLKVPVPHGLLV